MDHKNEINGKLEEIEDYILRWKKHNKIIQFLKESNVNKGELEIWENQINLYFNQKIKSHL